MGGIHKRLCFVCGSAYEVADLLLKSFLSTGYVLRRPHLFYKQVYNVGNRSLVIVSVMGAFIGMILALHVGFITRQLNLQYQIGATGVAIIKEFGPVITAFILSGRIGSAYAAEIGTMKVYEEVDALTVMGVRPVAYLAAPRLLACMFMLPVLVIYADFMGLLGGALVARSYVGVGFSQFFQVFFQYITFADVWRSMVKSLCFGVIIATAGCYFGFKTTGGAEGVGRSTTASVVWALLSVLVADYFIERILLGL